VGSAGFYAAADQHYGPDEVILEVGAERTEGSTTFLAGLGVLVVVVDVDEAALARVGNLLNVQTLHGLAEQVLVGWQTPIRFAWLDGHDWPYDGRPEGHWDQQRAEYHARGQEYSKRASQASHGRIAELVAPAVAPGGVVAFDDTWRVAPSTWDGKGGLAVPYLLDLGFELVSCATDPEDAPVLLRKPA